MSAPASEFEGKTAIVTGGGSGVGFAIARAFARAGARVAIAGRTHDRLARAAAAIEERAGEVLTVEADVAVAAACERLVEAAVERSARPTSWSTTRRCSPFAR